MNKPLAISTVLLCTAISTSFGMFVTMTNVKKINYGKSRAFHVTDLSQKRYHRKKTKSIKTEAPKPDNVHEYIEKAIKGLSDEINSIQSKYRNFQVQLLPLAFEEREKHSSFEKGQAIIINGTKNLEKAKAEELDPLINRRAHLISIGGCMKQKYSTLPENEALEKGIEDTVSYMEQFFSKDKDSSEYLIVLNELEKVKELLSQFLCTDSTKE